MYGNEAVDIALFGPKMIDMNLEGILLISVPTSHGSPPRLVWFGLMWFEYASVLSLRSMHPRQTTASGRVSLAVARWMEQIRIAEIIQEVDVPGTIVQLRHLDFHDTPRCLISFARLENQLSAALKRIEHPEHGS
jgi:hypothetical protein